MISTVLILLPDKCDITAAQYCFSITELYIVANLVSTRTLHLSNVDVAAERVEQCLAFATCEHCCCQYNVRFTNSHLYLCKVYFHVLRLMFMLML